jgi:hypothetical protein
MATVLQAVAGGLAGASLLFLANAGCAEEEETCEGAELEEVIDALSEAHKAGSDCAIAVDLDFTDPEFESCIQVAISEAQERRARMSGACQRLYDEVSEKLRTGSGSPPGGTQCTGGVCCDDTGCYGG